MIRIKFPCTYAEFCSYKDLHNKYFIEFTRKTKCADIIRRLPSYIKAKFALNYCKDNHVYGKNLYCVYIKKSNEIIYKFLVADDLSMLGTYDNHADYGSKYLRSYARSMIIGTADEPSDKDSYSYKEWFYTGAGFYVIFDLVDEDIEETSNETEEMRDAKSMELEVNASVVDDKEDNESTISIEESTNDRIKKFTDNIRYTAIRTDVMKREDIIFEKPMTIEEMLRYMFFCIHPDACGVVIVGNYDEDRVHQDYSKANVVSFENYLKGGNRICVCKDSELISKIDESGYIHITNRKYYHCSIIEIISEYAYVILPQFSA